MPAIKGILSPLNAQLRKAPPTIGLSSKSKLREVLEHAQLLIEDLQSRPTHVHELVPSLYPLVYGYFDASSEGVGGVWLPCTATQFDPVVWRLEWPKDIQEQIQLRHGSITNSDAELSAAFLGYAKLNSKIDLQHHSTYLDSDNKPTVAWTTKYSSRAESLIPDRFLHLIAFI